MVDGAVTAPDCGHLGRKYQVLTLESAESAVCCADCVWEELESLPDGWTVEITTLSAD